MRSPSAVLLLISLFFVTFARSQSHELLIQGQTGKLYLEHTVVAKENWYSVGRLYNITAKELTAFNQLALTQPLAIGQSLQIPLTAVNFSQNGQKAPTETLVPVYHIIQEKEWMYRISVNHNKVPIPSLEKWNNVNKEQIHSGMHLIVGYLRVKTALSALATAGAGAPLAASGKEGAVGAGKAGGAGAPGEGAAAGGVGTGKVGAGGSVGTGTPAVGASGTGTAGAGKVAGTKGSGTGMPAGGASGAEEYKTNADTTSDVATSKAPAVKEKAANLPVNQPSATTTVPATTGGAKPATTTPTSKPAVTPTPAGTSSHNGGAFKGDYGESGKSGEGQAGTFKSTSGWQDGKYYALMNNIPVGTVVKVEDTSSGKVIYAKVLGQLPDMKESAGLTIRISNAAAAELGQGEGRFGVSVTY